MPGFDAATAWSTGRFRGDGPARLLFGWIHEDSAIERCVFPPGGRIFSIASGGCTALDLMARGDHVTAVDLNPVQIDYVARRRAGERPTPGFADRFLARARHALGAVWRSEREWLSFLDSSDPRAQGEEWREHFDTAVFRRALDLGLGRRILRLVYSPSFVEALPARFGEIVRGRLARGFGLHPNRTNPYAWRLWLDGWTRKESAGDPRLASSGALELEVADAARFLEASPAASFDGFTLSNILDGAGPGYRQRLIAAVWRAAAPGATLVLRSLGEPESENAAAWAAHDRSMLWGSVTVEEVATGRSVPCFIG